MLDRIIPPLLAIAFLLGVEWMLGWQGVVGAFLALLLAHIHFRVTVGHWL